MTAKRSGRKRPSMFEVAKLAGVSHQTVSRVINELFRKGVNPPVDVLPDRKSVV